MSPSTDPSPPVVVFTDLDGCLLDGITYSWEPAREALEVLRARRIPLVLVSSKTRAELEAIRSQLQLDHPFVSENGGAVFSPDGYFSTSPEEAVRRDDYEVIELGTPYPTLRQALRELEQAVGVQLRGFGDMSIEEIAERTGLTEANVHLARQREYDEPFLIEGPAAVIRVTLRITSGADAVRTYVLGNGSAFGAETPPGPVGAAESVLAAAALAGVGAWLFFAGAHATAAIRPPAMSK